MIRFAIGTVAAFAGTFFLVHLAFKDDAPKAPTTAQAKPATVQKSAASIVTRASDDFNSNRQKFDRKMRDIETDRINNERRFKDDMRRIELQHQMNELNWQVKSRRN